MNAEPMQEIASMMAMLINALEQWKCNACGGSGVYLGFVRGANGQPVPCRVCDGRGMHPVAYAALKKVRTK